jgi:hypothetical protein
MGSAEAPKDDRESTSSLVWGWIIAVLLVVGSWAAREDAAELAELHEEGVRQEADLLGVYKYHSGGRDGSWEYRATVRFVADEQTVSGDTVIDKEQFELFAEMGTLTQGGGLAKKHVYVLEQEARLSIVYLPRDPEFFMFNDPADERSSARIVSWIMLILGSSLAVFMTAVTFRSLKRRSA